MKKFTKILLCLILCVVTFGLVACKDKDSFVYPSESGVAVGNGGMAVSVGEYVYFVNGFISVDDLVDSDRNGSFTVGSIMVAKLDSNGNLVLDDDGLLDDDYYRTISSKLAGFEATGLYAFGEYLYFTTPCQEMSKGDTWEKDLVDFYRIKLDGSGSAKRIYQSTVENDSLEFAFYNADGKTYLLVYEEGDDGNCLYRIDASKTKDNIVETIENVTSVVMPVDDGSETVATDYLNVFYTTKSDDSLYSLTRLDVISGDKETMWFKSATKEIEVLAVAQDKYVFVAVESDYGSSKDIYRYSLLNTNDTGMLVLGSMDDYSDVYFTPDGNSVIAIWDDEDYVIDVWNITSSCVVYYSIEDEAEITTFIGFVNGCIVYLDGDNSIKMASYANVIAGGDANITTLVTDEDGDIQTTYFDLDSNYVYYYKTVGSNVYLFRVAVNNNAGSREEEIVGVYETDDIPEVEDDEEETTEE